MSSRSSHHQTACVVLFFSAQVWPSSPTNSTGGAGQEQLGGLSVLKQHPTPCPCAPQAPPTAGALEETQPGAQPRAPISAHTTSREELSYPFIYKQINVK